MDMVEARTRPLTKALVARMGMALLGLLFVVSGIAKLGRFSIMAGVLAGKGLPFPEAVLGTVILIEVACGMALVLKWQAAKAAAILAIFVVAATLMFHAFWAVDAAAFQNQFNHFLKNMAILGALLTVTVLASESGSRS